MTALKTQKRQRRQARVRAKISGTAERPRLSVYRSNRYITGQLIDDVTGNTIASASSQKMDGKNFTEKAQKAGEAIAEAAKKAGISEVVFDRGGFMFTGRVKALAEGARQGGLKF